MEVVEHTSLFGRIKSALVGVLIGVILFLVSFPLLFWNEGRAVSVAKGLKQGRKEVVSVSIDRVDAAHEGKLVHFSGEATTDESLQDQLFGIQADAIRLVRNVEMYQWKEDSRSEKKKKLGGGTETRTEYTYKKVWDSQLHRSADFQEQIKHENPSEFPVPAWSATAGKVTVGSFRLPAALIDKIGNPQPLSVNLTDVPEAMAAKLAKVDAASNMLFMSHAGNSTYASPQVGDVRISFEVVQPQTVSVLAQQLSDSLGPYNTDRGNPIQDLRSGQLTADQMFDAAESEARMWTWILRLVGCLAMFFGMMLMVGPLTVVADVIPLVGDLVETGTALVAGLIAIGLSALTIALAWLFFRPLIGIPLLIVACLAIYFLFRLIGKTRRRRFDDAKVEVV